MNNTPGLRRFLHYCSDFLRQDARWRVLAIYLPVGLCSFTGLGYQDTKVWAHAGIDNPDIWTYY